MAKKTKTAAPFANAKTITAEIRSELLGVGSDRAAFIVAGACVDEALRELLLIKFRNVKAAEEVLGDAINAPAGTFSARILLAHALGMIDADERRCLDGLRKLRNQYAHEFGMNLDPASTADRARDLLKNVAKALGQEVEITGSAKVNYAHAAVAMAGRLLERRNEIALDEVKKSHLMSKYKFDFPSSPPTA